jgi:hypothetical protein
MSCSPPLSDRCLRPGDEWGRARNHPPGGRRRRRSSVPWLVVGVPTPRHRKPRPDGPPRPFDRALSLVDIDFPSAPSYPGPLRWTAATLLALSLSLAADAALVAIATSLVPAIKGYVHFRFSDYGKLTVVGVLIACVAWPLVTAVSSSPRRLFFRLAILVTLVLWLPDLWILKGGQPVRAVLVLMAMHLAIALVTYNALVHLAPPRPRPSQDGGPD